MAKQTKKPTRKAPAAITAGERAAFRGGAQPKPATPTSKAAMVVEPKREVVLEMELPFMYASKTSEYVFGGETGDDPVWAGDDVPVAEADDPPAGVAEALVPPQVGLLVEWAVVPRRVDLDDEPSVGPGEVDDADEAFGAHHGVLARDGRQPARAEELHEQELRVALRRLVLRRVRDSAGAVGDDAEELLVHDAHAASSSAAATVRSTCSSVWASDGKRHSNCDGGR